jgi:hypothetical protein
MTFAQSSRPVQLAETQRLVPAGPTLIDPKLFKFIGGGSPRGTWAAAPSTAEALSVQSPRGTW